MKVHGSTVAAGDDRRKRPARYGAAATGAAETYALGARSPNRKTLTVLIVAPYAHETTGGQAKFATYLVDGLRGRLRILNVVVPHHSRRRWPARLFTTLTLLCRFVYLLVRHRVDVVHVFAPCHRLALYEKLAFTLIARGLRRRTILNFRNALDWWYERWRPAEQRILARLIGMNSVVLCQYQALARYLVRQGIAGRRQVRVLSNGLCPSEVPAARRVGSRNSVAKILLLGSVGYRKGVDRLIQAAALLRDRGSRPFVVQLVGPPDSADELDRLMQLARQLGADRHVRFCGPVSAEGKTSLLAGADIFALPSRAEGFPNSLLEAMAAALPVVVSDRGAMPEIVRPGVGGFVVDPEDPHELAGALAALIGNPRLRQRMGARNRRLVQRQYDLRSVLGQFQALYEDVGGQRPRRMAA